MRHHVAATLGDRDDLAAALRALADARARRCRERRARCSPTSTPARRATRRPRRAACASAELPGGGRRASRSCWRRPRRQPGRRRAPSARPGAAGRGPRPARHAPDDGRADGPLAAARSSSSSGCRRPTTSTCSARVARENPRDERLVALAEVRDLTPVRDEDGRVTALPELERMRAEAFEAMRSRPGQPPAARAAALEPRCCSTSGRRSTSRPRRPARSIDRFARMTAGLGLEMVDAPRPASLEDGVERERVLRLFDPAGRGVIVELDDPPTEPLQPLDEGAQRIVPARRRGTLHPAEIVKLARAGDAGEFVEHDLDDDGRARARSTARRPRTAPSIVVGLIRNRTDRHPEGMLRVVAARRPDARARLARRARVPARSSPRSTSPSELGVPVRVVRALLRRARSRWTPAPRTWTGSRRRCGGSWSSRRRAARSTSSSAASTSARSRTGTPRRRCSCTRAASS